MSKVYLALEKAEKEKHSKPAQNGSSFEILEVTSSPAGNDGAGLKDLPKEIEKYGLPIRGEEFIPIASMGSFAGEQFRKLKTYIFRVTPIPPKILLVTSTIPQEGKTTITINLALSISQELNKRVIVLDADLRNPSIYPAKFSKTKGLSDYLSNDTPVAEIMKSFDSDKFIVIPAGSASAKAAELLSSKKMKELIDKMRELDEDTFILIDSPPILSTSESLMLSEWVDGVILVVKANQALRGSVKKAIEAIAKKKIIGIVFNNKELKPSKSYSEYYYGYRYHKKNGDRRSRWRR